jgi:type II restriction enzyme
MYRDEPVAIFELKSQVGSFGNNLNNRVEEILGQSRDLREAGQRSLVGTLPPWFAYLMVVESSNSSQSPVKNQSLPPGLRVEKAFVDSPSYIERYAIALRRMRHEKDLDAVCLVATDKSDGSFYFPDSSMSFRAFVAAIEGRALEVRGALG